MLFIPTFAISLNKYKLFTPNVRFLAKPSYRTQTFLRTAGPVVPIFLQPWTVGQVMGNGKVPQLPMLWRFLRRINHSINCVHIKYLAETSNHISASTSVR